MPAARPYRFLYRTDVLRGSPSLRRVPSLPSCAEFHRYGDGYQPWCKTCRRAYDRAYHQRVRLRRIAQKRARAAEFRAWNRDLKACPCTDCGGIFHPAAMQWDHGPGMPKKGNVSWMLGRHSRRTLEEEIRKCELVCANCHAVRTLLRQRDVAQLGRAPRLGRGGSRVQVSPSRPEHASMGTTEDASPTTLAISLWDADAHVQRPSQAVHRERDADRPDHPV